MAPKKTKPKPETKPKTEPKTAEPEVYPTRGFLDEFGLYRIGMYPDSDIHVAVARDLRSRQTKATFSHGSIVWYFEDWIPDKAGAARHAMDFRRWLLILGNLVRIRHEHENTKGRVVNDSKALKHFSREVFRRYAKGSGWEYWSLFAVSWLV